MLSTFNGRMSGCHVDPLTPEGLRQIEIGDIAHALASEPRWNGSTFVPYSVADHCLNCLYWAKKETQDAARLLNVLMHDAEEAVFHDLPRFLKRHPELQGYVKLSVRFRFNLFAALRVPWLQDDPLIKLVDDTIGAMEYQEMIASQRLHFLRYAGAEHTARTFTDEFLRLLVQLT